MNNRKYKAVIFILVVMLFVSVAFLFIQKVEYEKRILFWEIKHATVMYETNWIPLWEYEKENQ